MRQSVCGKSIKGIMRMEKIKFYNMNGIHCWIINLKPFEPDEPNDKIRSLQEDCVQNKIFGIGWRTGYFDTHTKVYELRISRMEISWYGGDI